MKIWRFYLIDSDQSTNKYDLYAITNNKKIAKLFREQRNMKKFIERVTEEDREIYADFANANRNEVLDIYSVITKKDGTYTKKINVNIVCTNYEMVVIKDSGDVQCSIDDEYFWKYAIDIRIYNKKMLKALEIIQYDLYYKLFTNFNTDDTDYSAPDMWVDELQSLLFIFKDTFF